MTAGHLYKIQNSAAEDKRAHAEECEHLELRCTNTNYSSTSAAVIRFGCAATKTAAAIPEKRLRCGLNTYLGL